MGTDGKTDFAQLFAKHFGSDYVSLERSVQEHLTSSKMEKAYRDPVANQTRYFVKRIFKKGKIVHVAAVITTSPSAAREWKEQQEKEFPRAKFYTIVCDSLQKAEYEMRKFNSLGR